MKPIAEVVESSCRLVIAQCTQRKDRPPIAQPPPYGSLVLIEGEPEIVGVVSAIQTTGYDTSRRPMAFEMSLSELYEEYPELPELLITRMEALVLGCRTGKGFYQGTPPQPPPLHGGVREFPAEDLPAFLSQMHFLHLIYESPREGGEELLLQTIRHLLKAAPSPLQRREWLLDMGRQLALLFREEYHRLKYLLERIESTIEGDAS